MLYAKVTVKFVACSDDILIYALQKWEQFSLLHGLSLKKKVFFYQWVFVLDRRIFDLWPLGYCFRHVDLRFRLLGLGVRPLGLRFRPQGLHPRPVGLRLDHWNFVLDYRVFILDQWVFILDHRVFVFKSSFSTHPFKSWTLFRNVLILIVQWVYIVVNFSYVLS